MWRLLLARHGVTTANQEGRYIGRTDPPLSDLGLAQARSLASRLTHEGLTAIYSSPQLRARRTAEMIARACGLEVRFESELREMDFGQWDGLTRAEIEQRYPGQMQRWQADPLTEPAAHGGETLAHLAQRVAAAGDRIMARHADGEVVLVVAHGGVLQTLLCHALGSRLRPRWPYRLEAAALSELQVFDGQAVLVLLNDVGHLHP